jgi:hypothetical protein
MYFFEIATYLILRRRGKAPTKTIKDRHFVRAGACCEKKEKLHIKESK